MQILLQKRRRIAGSNSQGKFVAPKTNSLFLLSLPTPSICTKNYVLTLFDDSFSPSLLLPVIESTSSIKTIEDFSPLAIQKRVFTILSLSPTNLDIISELETEKKVDSDISEAQALAMNVFPVPGGPQSKIPFQGLRLPLNIQGKRSGMTTASLSAYLALTNPATSSHVTLGFSLTTTPSRAFLSSFFQSFGQLFNIFFLPSLFLIYSLIVLISFKNQSSACLKAAWVDEVQSLSSSMNLRYIFLAPSLATVMASKSIYLLA